MTSTLRPSLNNNLSFRLIDLTISFSIKHLAILLKLIHCLAICIANDATSRNSGVTVPTSHTTTSLWTASWSFGMFPIISLSVSSFSCCSLIDADLPYTLPFSGNSQPNEADGTPRGSSAQSNQPNDGNPGAS
jgi:hypothetical protein